MTEIRYEYDQDVQNVPNGSIMLKIVQGWSIIQTFGQLYKILNLSFYRWTAFSYLVCLFEQTKVFVSLCLLPLLLVQQKGVFLLRNFLHLLLSPVWKECNAMSKQFNVIFLLVLFSLATISPLR